MSSKILLMHQRRKRIKEGKKLPGLQGMLMRLGCHYRCSDCGKVVPEQEEYKHKKIHHPMKLRKLQKMLKADLPSEPVT
jgi:hypothetical protein